MFRFAFPHFSRTQTLISTNLLKLGSFRDSAHVLPGQGSVLTIDDYNHAGKYVRWAIDPVLEFTIRDFPGSRSIHVSRAELPVEGSTGPLFATDITTKDGNRPQYYVSLNNYGDIMLSNGLNYIRLTFNKEHRRTLGDGEQQRDHRIESSCDVLSFSRKLRDGTLMLEVKERKVDGGCLPLA